MTQPPDDPGAFHVGRHRPTQGSRAGMAAITRAQHFACLVRDEGPDSTGAYLDALDREALYGLVVTLAAMTPIDRTPAELLAWVADHDQPALPLEETA